MTACSRIHGLLKLPHSITQSEYIPNPRIQRLAELAGAEPACLRQGLYSNLEIELPVVPKTERVIYIGENGLHTVQVIDHFQVPAFESVQESIVLQNRNCAQKVAYGQV